MNCFTNDSEFDIYVFIISYTWALQMSQILCLLQEIDND